MSALGFLPTKCYTKLPDKFGFMQPVFDNLAENVCKNIRPIMDALPKYDMVNHSIYDLPNDQKRFMYSFLSMAANRYVWCTGVSDAKHNAVLPDIIGRLWQELSDTFEIRAAVTHAAVDLWNWKYIDDTKPFGLNNIDVIMTMTGEQDEAWFYKVMIAIEGIGGQILTDIGILKNALIHKDNRVIKIFMDRFLELLQECVSIIGQMRLGCRPDFFFNNLRIYLSGSKNDNLPLGITLYDDVRIENKGGSAAQSTIIPVFDALLGVVHDSHSKEFLDEMHLYMPVEHCNHFYKIRDDIDLAHYISESGNDELINLHNKCVSALCTFRRHHISIIHTYIMRFAAAANNENNAHEEKGTGGTNPIEFCTQIVNNLLAARIVKPVNGLNRWHDMRKYVAIFICAIIVRLVVASFY
jgi:indoleamine 2,3-dioxygenase